MQHRNIFHMTKGSANAFYLAGAIALVAGLMQGSYQWAWASLFVHILAISLFSAVVHRYFCHKVFEANKNFMWALSIIPTIYNYATPLQWAVMHSAHHAYADTDKDPHLKGWKGVFTATYRNPPPRHLVATKWFRDGKHQTLFNYSVLFIMGWNLLLLCVSVDAMIWVGLVPIFTLSLANGLHRAFSHSNNKAKNRWYLELLVPMGGEWIHDEHHENARKPVYTNKWYELDTGGLLIWLLRKRAI